MPGSFCLKGSFGSLEPSCLLRRIRLRINPAKMPSARNVTPRRFRELRVVL